MKKVVIGVTVLALVLSMGVMVMAEEGNDDWVQKNYEFQKDYINQQLEEGLITEQQAEYILERLEGMKEYYEEHGDELDNRGYGAYQMPCGMGGAGFGPMMHGPGMMGGYGHGPGMMGGYGPGMM
jgi:hypothetical protein